MANTAQAAKRARQAKKRALQNVSQRSRIRTTLKKALNITQAHDPAAVQSMERETVSLLDKMARRGLIHKNRAARLKSRLARRLKPT
ncbi:MAG: 30S ribosomal protein S20 [Coxiella sp. RIFCSPHIGHO2_12_FULL_44_14]|nr:MAG: 30S ribosomal protein S20 [Coxiella sp. RIFCSPHIGHO2_12_FULL_44_14]